MRTMKSTQGTGTTRIAGCAVTLVVVLFVFVVALVSLFKSYSWFTLTNSASADGVNLSSSSGAVTFGESLTTTRTLGTSVTVATYRLSGTNDRYYLYDDLTSSFTTDGEGALVPFTLSAVIPGETLDIALSFTGTGDAKGNGWTFSLKDLSDATDGTFTAADGTYSVFGIYRIYVEESGVFVDKGFIADYSLGPTHPTAFTVASGSWGSGTVDFTFRISVDLTQYKALSGTVTNQLSEKYVSIGQIRVEPSNE